MTIDASGKWWVGTAPEDVGPYLEAYASEGYTVDEFRLSRCGCGSDVFRLQADDEEGCAQRECASCGARHFICGSAEFWDEASPETFICLECQSDTCNVGVGYSLYPEKNAVKWLYVGERCVKCGVLGCFAGWKVGYEPSLQLLEQA